MSLSYYFNQYWDDIANPTLNHIFPGGPFLILLMIAVYLLLVLRIGPDYMKDRQPYQLKTVIKYYNIINIVSNFFMTVACLYWSRFTIDCWKCDHDLTPTEITLAWILSPSLLLMKLFDFFDTFFFILRKKSNQVSALHVFHHAGMPFAIWCGTKFYPYIPALILPCLNCGVHTVMYTYYYMAADPYYKPYLWWKRHLTKMQLIQFGILVLMGLRLMFSPDCKRTIESIPPVFVLMGWVCGLLVIFGFSRFYYDSYIRNMDVQKIRANVNRRFSEYKMEVIRRGSVFLEKHHNQ